MIASLIMGLILLTPTSAVAGLGGCHSKFSPIETRYLGEWVGLTSNESSVRLAHDIRVTQEIVQNLGVVYSSPKGATEDTLRNTLHINQSKIAKKLDSLEDLIKTLNRVDQISGSFLFEKTEAVRRLDQNILDLQISGLGYEVYKIERAFGLLRQKLVYVLVEALNFQAKREALIDIANAVLNLDHLVRAHQGLSEALKTFLEQGYSSLTLHPGNRIDIPEGANLIDFLYDQPVIVELKSRGGYSIRNDFLEKSEDLAKYYNILNDIKSPGDRDLGLRPDLSKSLNKIQDTIEKLEGALSLHPKEDGIFCGRISKITLNFFEITLDSNGSTVRFDESIVPFQLKTVLVRVNTP